MCNGGIFFCRDGELTYVLENSYCKPRRNRGSYYSRLSKRWELLPLRFIPKQDKNELHAALADESYCIGPSEAQESYLNESRIISAALLAGAQAIHPGYGFLSENAHFARLCRKNGIVFIGPAPESMERLSDKALLKELISETGLTVIPGTKAVSSAAEAALSAAQIGYPVMLKACGGRRRKGHTTDTLGR